MPAIPANISAKYSEYFSKGFEFNLGRGWVFAPTYWQAGAIILLIFLLVITLAQVRRHFLDWSFKGAFFGISLGFLLAVIVEGFLLLSGHTILTSLLGWKNPPKPISTALDMGKKKLVDTLGVSTQDSTSEVQTYTSDGVVKIFQSLSPVESRKAKSLICQP